MADRPGSSPTSSPSPAADRPASGPEINPYGELRRHHSVVERQLAARKISAPVVDPTEDKTPAKPAVVEGNGWNPRADAYRLRRDVAIGRAYLLPSPGGDVVVPSPNPGLHPAFQHRAFPAFTPEGYWNARVAAAGQGEAMPGKDEGRVAVRTLSLQEPMAVAGNEAAAARKQLSARADIVPGAAIRPAAAQQAIATQNPAAVPAAAPPVVSIRTRPAAAVAARERDDNEPGMDGA